MAQEHEVIESVCYANCILEGARETPPDEQSPSLEQSPEPRPGLESTYTIFNDTYLGSGHYLGSGTHLGSVNRGARPVIYSGQPQKTSADKEPGNDDEPKRSVREHNRQLASTRQSTPSVVPRKRSYSECLHSRY